MKNNDRTTELYVKILLDGIIMCIKYFDIKMTFPPFLLFLFCFSFYILPYFYCLKKYIFF